MHLKYLWTRYRGPMSIGAVSRAPIAAFFDLDKTILAKSSSFAFARPFYKEGLIGRADVIKSAYAQFVYLASGADHDQMESMRQYMSNLVTGWEVEKVQQIVAETLDTIVDPMVYEEALDLIAHHRMLRHQIIIISSSGTDVVEPIGQRLGADLAIGTQVGIEDGKYTGEILFYAYGPGKAEAMRSLAAERGYDLTECYAYSDSFTDVPMLEAVGHPVAVNPDTELRKLAVEHNWPIRDFAKPVAMKSRIDKKQAAAAGAGAWELSSALRLKGWYVPRLPAVVGSVLIKPAAF